MADTADRRMPIRTSSGVLKRELNPSQLATLNTLERFGWELKFIRSEPANKLAVLFDPRDKEHLVVHREPEQDRERDRRHEALDRARLVEADEAHPVAKLDHQVGDRLTVHG